MLKYGILTFLIILTSCNNAAFEDCSNGLPKPLYDNDFPEVVKHHFEINREYSLETIQFSNNYSATVKQSGCDNFIQEFTFTFNSPPYFPEDWQFLTIQEFKKLGSQRNDNIAYTAWADLMDARIDALHTGESVELSRGFHASMKRTLGDGKFQIKIKLTEVPH